MTESIISHLSDNSSNNNMSNTQTKPFELNPIEKTKSIKSIKSVKSIKSGTSFNSDSLHIPISRITTTNSENHFYIDNEKYNKQELIDAFGGELEPGYHPPPVYKFAQPAPLGLSGYALTMFVFSMCNAGARGIEINNAAVVPALFYGGGIQIIAGIFELLLTNAFGATMLCSFGGGAISLAVVKIPWFNIENSYDSPEEFSHAMGILYLGFAIFSFMLTVLTLKSTLALFSLLTLHSLTLLLLAIAKLTVSSTLTKVGGVFGVVTAFAAWYNAYAGVSNPQNSYFPVKTLKLEKIWGLM